MFNREAEEFERRKKEAEKKGEEADPVKASEEEVVRLVGMMPPLNKMDKELLTLKNV